MSTTTRASRARIPWTDQDLVGLFETVLVETLRSVVDGRSGATTRTAALAWLNRDDDHPFGFRSCATTLGIDPDEFRTLFKDTAAKSAEPKSTNR